MNAPITTVTGERADLLQSLRRHREFLLFTVKDLTDEQQLAFALNFGERERAHGGTVVKKEDYRLTSGLNDVSNLGKDSRAN